MAAQYKAIRPSIDLKLTRYCRYCDDETEYEYQPESIPPDPRYEPKIEEGFICLKCENFEPTWEARYFERRANLRLVK